VVRLPDAAGVLNAPAAVLQPLAPDGLDPGATDCRPELGGVNPGEIASPPPVMWVFPVQEAAPLTAVPEVRGTIAVLVTAVTFFFFFFFLASTAGDRAAMVSSAARDSAIAAMRPFPGDCPALPRIGESYSLEPCSECGAPITGTLRVAGLERINRRELR
jgi:hypothetical protein